MQNSGLREQPAEIVHGLWGEGVSYSLSRADIVQSPRSENEPRHALTHINIGGVDSYFDILLCSHSSPVIKVLLDCTHIVQNCLFLGKTSAATNIGNKCVLRIRYKFDDLELAR